MAGADAREGIADLLTLSMPEDADRLARLPEPFDSGLAKASKRDLKKLAGHFRCLLAVLIGGAPLGSVPSEKRRSRVLDPEEGEFWSLYGKAAGYYAFCLHRFARRSSEPNAAAVVGEPQISVPDPRSESLREFAKNVRLLSAQRLLLAHDSCFLGMLIASQMDQFGLTAGDLGEKYDADLRAIEELESFHEVVSSSSDGEMAAANLFFAHCMQHRKFALQKRGKQRKAEGDQLGLNPKELPLLGIRHELMTEKYGAKRVERVYERQLAIAFQSFGFTVVPASAGEVAADLLCIARAERFSFLVDAKSSRRPYGLPKADRRAISEYASSFAAEMYDLPPLAFVLVVGGSPSKTLPRKLQELEREAGVPVRFMAAPLVAKLRRELPGPVLPKVFRDAVVKAGPVVDASLVASCKEAIDSLVSTYAGFVRGLKELSGSAEPLS